MLVLYRLWRFCLTFALKTSIILPMFARRFSSILISFLLLVFLVGNSTPAPFNPVEQVRAFTREVEFDFVSWTLDTAIQKMSLGSLAIPRYLTLADQQKIVLDTIQRIAEIQTAERHLEEIYADPNIANPKTASALTRAHLQQLQNEQQQFGPLAEQIFQTQISLVLKDLGLTLGGQPLPPVLYHSTPLPYALIVSPRDTIRQDADISLIPDFSLEARMKLENQVSAGLDVSSLVVPVGGIGTYPTMVQQSSDLNWLAEVVAHEWTHNFLTLRPLGLSYERTPEMRIINETAASIVGKEISHAFISRFYPSLLPPPAENTVPQKTPPPAPPPFDFRAEMHLTRITVDQMLSEGKIEQAESYMEERRQFFWEKGYHIRKLNQAYFAFYGAYADQPGGAAGADPVGAAVRAFRAQSPTLASFIKRLSWMTSLEQLQQAIKEPKP